MKIINFNLFTRSYRYAIKIIYRLHYLSKWVPIQYKYKTIKILYTIYIPISCIYDAKENQQAFPIQLCIIKYWNPMRNFSIIYYFFAATDCLYVLTHMEHILWAFYYLFAATFFLPFLYSFKVFKMYSDKY